MELVFIAAADRAQLRIVKTGKTLGSEVEIVSGIEPGEKVITGDVAQLRDGQPVKIKS
jgi:multidrug efflux pump subunit AcrA (membrane-fusion protein)